MLIPSIKTFTFGEDLGATELQDGVNAPLNYLYDRPLCQVVLGTNFAITTGGSFKLITWDSETNDNDSMHSLVTNPNRITFATGGFYLLGGQIRFAAAASGRAEVMLRTGANGSPTGGTELLRGVVPLSGGGCTVAWTRLGGFSVSNYIEMYVFQDSPGTINALAGADSTLLWAHQLGT